MKYVLSWETRLNGTTAENEASAKRGLELFSKWTVPAGLKIEQFVGRIDGGGGFAVVETDDPADLLDGASKFVPFNEFHIFPVVDLDEWMQAANTGIEFRDSIT